MSSKNALSELVKFQIIQILKLLTNRLGIKTSHISSFHCDKLYHTNRSF